MAFFPAPVLCYVQSPHPACPFLCCVVLGLSPRRSESGAGVVPKDQDGTYWGLGGFVVRRVGGMILVVLSFGLDPKGPKDQD